MKKRDPQERRTEENALVNPSKHAQYNSTEVSVQKHRLEPKNMLNMAPRR
jgi:hypothetical protein